MVSTELLEYSNRVEEANRSTSKALQVMMQTWSVAKKPALLSPPVVTGVPVSMGNIVDLTHTADGCDECGADKVDVSACGKPFCAEHLSGHSNCSDCKAITTRAWKIGEHQVSAKWYQACAIIAEEPLENFLVWGDFVAEMTIMVSLLKHDDFASIRKGKCDCFLSFRQSSFRFLWR
jgi:hypothetical protein